MQKFEKYFDNRGKVKKIKVALKDCPEEFKRDNQFTLYAAKYIRNADKSNWKWKVSFEEKEITFWYPRFRHMMLSANNDIDDRIIFGGWMLSEMLVEVPT